MDTGTLVSKAAAFLYSSRPSELAKFSDVNCPNCKHEMVEGRIQVRGTWLGFLLVGFSRQHLFFDPDFVAENRALETRRLIHSGESRTAYRCPKCDGFFSPGSPVFPER